MKQENILGDVLSLNEELQANSLSGAIFLLLLEAIVCLLKLRSVLFVILTLYKHETMSLISQTSTNSTLLPSTAGAKTFSEFYHNRNS